MQLIDRIAEQRERQVIERVLPMLENGERVTHWTRARKPRTNKRGVAFLTNRRFITLWGGTLWGGRQDGDEAIAWDDVEAWGVDARAPGGPLLALEGTRNGAVVQMIVDHARHAERVKQFLERYQELSSPPRRSLERYQDHGDFEPTVDVAVETERRSLGQFTRRAAITILGITLVVLGVLLLVLPGPGIIVTIAGLAVLGSEYDWAEDLLTWVKQRSKATTQRFKSRRRAE